MLGVAGVGLISSDPLRESVPLPSLLAVLGSVLCFAQATVVVRRYPSVHPVVMNGIAMAVGALILLGVSALLGESIAFPDRAATWIAVGYLVAVGSIGAFLLYVFLIQRWTASRASYVMVVIPFVTVILSAWLDDEPIGLGLLVGALFVLTGVYIGALRPARAREESARQSS